MIEILQFLASDPLVFFGEGVPHMVEGKFALV